MIYPAGQKEAMAKVTFTSDNSGAAAGLSKKLISLQEVDGSPAMILTNEHGNTVRYQLDPGTFDALHAELWRFVKESQH